MRCFRGRTTSRASARWVSTTAEGGSAKTVAPLTPWQRASNTVAGAFASAEARVASRVLFTARSSSIAERPKPGGLGGRALFDEAVASSASGGVDSTAAERLLELTLAHTAAAVPVPSLEFPPRCDPEPAAVAAEAAALAMGSGRNAGAWADDPTSAELHVATLDALAEALRLPRQYQWAVGPGCGLNHPSEEEALLFALTAARMAAQLGGEMATAVKRFQQPGVDTRNLTVYCHPQQQPFVSRVCRFAGIERVRCPTAALVGTRGNYRVSPDDFAALIEEDVARGFKPLMLIGSFGPLRGTCTVDDVPMLGAVAANARLWLHLDAGFGGAAGALAETEAGPSAALAMELEHACDAANSIHVNAGRWLALGRPHETQLYFADRRAAAVALRGQKTEASQRHDAGAYIPDALELGRFRMSELEAPLSTARMAAGLLNMSAVRERALRQLKASALLDEMLRGDALFEVPVDTTPFATVMFRPRLVSPDVTNAMLKRLEATAFRVSKADVSSGRLLVCCLAGTHEVADPARTAAAIFAALREARV